jgi:hypothetical protein
VRFDAQGRPVVEDTGPAQAASPCPITRNGLVNAIGTGAHSVVVAGFLRNNYRPATYSSAGPITPTRGVPLGPDFKTPDAAAGSDDSKVHSGILAAGSRSGSRVAMAGTSVAAPQVTRKIAGELAAGAAGDRRFVKALAAAREPGSPPAPAVSAERVGWGRADLLAPDQRRAAKAF